MRGIVAPAGELSHTLKTQKEQEAYQFVTESSHLAGDAFQLDPIELKRIADFVTEMDTINVLELNPATFKYADGLT